MAVLVANEYIDFNGLKDLLGVTDGNLASHIKHLEKKKYVRFSKEFVDRKPKTRYFATEEGRTAFEQHIKAIEQLLK
nr:transcriptional regulator [Membranihabitans maritimus]